MLSDPESHPVLSLTSSLLVSFSMAFVVLTSLYRADRNLFKGNNIYKDKEDRTQTLAKSLQLLQSDCGGTENLFLAIKTDISVSSESRIATSDLRVHEPDPKLIDLRSEDWMEHRQT